GAGAAKAEQRRPAGRAGAAERLLVITVMATPRLRRGVQRQRDVAVRALGHPTARPALRVMRMAAPVQEQQRLLPAIEPLAERHEQRARYERSALGLATEIDETHDRHAPPIDPVRQPHGSIPSA